MLIKQVDKDSPHLAGTITAFRAWMPLFVQRNSLQLRLVSYHTHQTWEAFTEARCTLHNHMAPSKRCVCGLYGNFSLPKTRLTYQGVLGVCEYWGKTEVHQQGIRAQKASIKAICPPPRLLHKPSQEQTALLVWAEQNSVAVVKDWKQLVDHHVHPISNTLLP